METDPAKADTDTDDADASAPPGQAPAGLTRDRLKDGSLLAAFRASAPPTMTVRSDAELAASLAATLHGRDPAEDLWVFGYGSLMWNPALHYVESSRADLQGWCRRFCIRLYMGRGTPEAPGLMLALDRGGVCRGVAFRIAAAHVMDELVLLWRREMLAGSYEARWVMASLQGRRVKALTFVVNRRGDRYARGLTARQVADFIATGKGTLGTCSAYFQTTLESLRAMGIKDAGLERIRQALESPAAACLPTPNPTESLRP